MHSITRRRFFDLTAKATLGLGSLSEAFGATSKGSESF